MRPAWAGPLRVPSFGLALLAGAHVGPAATWLPGLRRAFFPKLAGRGRPGHVALTFDDGPDPRSTPRFLDVLEAHGVRATFFLLGESTQRHPGLSREIATRGHELAVHGWTHDYPWWPSVRRDVRDLGRAADAVAAAAARWPRWYRPPYGILTGGRLAAAITSHLRPVLWSAWGRDWTAEATPDSVRATVRRDLRGGGTVLLHDCDRAAAPGCWRSALAALPGLIADCAGAGWSVGPLTEHMDTGTRQEQPGPGTPEAS
jgi:peptidoglycan/xylan/chitin deacetylase (PgdA/CDA1 family)